MTASGAGSPAGEEEDGGHLRRDPRTIPDDPDLLPLFPLLYVAWADEVLSADEIRFVRDRLSDEPWLKGETARTFLNDWLDPDRPPEPPALRALLRAVRRLGADLPRRRRRDLARLGIELARAERDDSEDWPPAGVVAALEDVERVLGVVGAEASRELLRRVPPGREGPLTRSALQPLPSYEPPFDVESMQALLDGDHAALRDRVRDLLAEPSFAHEYGLSKERYRERVWRWLNRLADEGLGRVGYPEAYGGTGDFGAAFAVFEELAHHDLSLVTKFGVQFGLFGGSILQLGTAEHHDRYLDRVGTAELPGCFAMTETGHGSNVRELRTTASYDTETGEFVVETPDVRARKDYIGNAAVHGRIATVFARLRVGEDDHGVHAFLVPIRGDEGSVLPGISIEDCGEKAGLQGVDNGRIRFDEVRIPRENLLDRFGRVSPEGEYSSPIAGASRRFFTMLGTLVAGRISIAAASVSVARTGLTIAVRYGDRRRQFGPAGEAEVPILDYRNHQRRLMPRLAATYGLHFAVRDLTRRYRRTDDDERREVEARAAGLKAHASRHAVDVLQTCRELCGGQGFLAENRLGRLRADADVFTTFEGANPVLLQLVARGLLTGFREEFEEMRIWSAARYVAERTVTALAERNPVTARRTAKDHLRDPDFQSGALRYREDRLLRSAALRLRGRIEEGMDSFEAMNDVQDHLLTLAVAHVERLVHGSFAPVLADAPDPAVGRALTSLRDLYGLWRIEQDRGWFLESGYMEGRKAKAIREQVNDLCGEVRDGARGLVDAFGIPDPVLAAPIALERVERDTG